MCNINIIDWLVFIEINKKGYKYNLNNTNNYKAMVEKV